MTTLADRATGPMTSRHLLSIADLDVATDPHHPRHGRRDARRAAARGQEAARPCAAAPWSTSSSRTRPAPAAPSRSPASGSRPTSSTSLARAPRRPRASSLRDTVLTVAAMGVDALVIRHGASGAAQQVSQWTDAARHQRRRRHARAPDPGPARRLHDAAPARPARGAARGDRRRPDALAGRAHQRAVLAKLGARVTVVAPPTLMPAGIDRLGRGRRVRHSRTTSTRCCPTADAVMMLRVQRERMSGGFFPTPREYTVGYGLTRSRLDALVAPSPTPSSATPAR